MNGISREVAFDNWTCTVSLSNQDPGLLHEVDQPISLKGSETMLDQIYLSPISFAFRLRHLSDALWDTEVGLLSEYWDDSIILHTTSGETVKMDMLYIEHRVTRP